MKPNMLNYRAKLLIKKAIFKLLCILELDSEFIHFRGRIKFIEDEGTPDEKHSDWQPNLITTAMKTALLTVLNGTNVQGNPGEITYGAVGTGTTAPAVGDTTLETEIERAAVSFTSISGVVLEERVFFTKAQANGTLREFAWFGEDAAAGADTGTMFNRVAINRVKTAAKTLTIVQEFSW